MIIESGMLFLSEYEEERRYGGPEEGGWWYTVRLFKRVAAIGDSQTLKVDQVYLEFLDSQREPEPHGDIGNDALNELGDGDTVSTIYPEGRIPRGWSENAERIYLVEKEIKQKDNSKEPPPIWE